MDWSASNVDRLTTLWIEGATTALIAAEIGAPSRDSVIGKAHRLNLPRRPSPLTRSGQAIYRKRTRPGFLDVEALATDTDGAASQPAAGLEWTGAARAMEDLRDGCKWPIGDPRDEGFSFCACAKDPASAYCKSHAGKGVQPVDSRRRPVQGRMSLPRAA